jgi:exopolyphosphatase
MGSCAADLDSIVASAAYAYLLAREGTSDGLVVPYLPIPRKDLTLRREVMYLFERVDLKWENLVFEDDVELTALVGGREAELVLVDTQGEDLSPAAVNRIAEVIDHHRVSPREEGQSLRRRIVEPVGSACTLVARQILERKPGILDAQLATLLLAAVLLDTVNLDPEAGRGTHRDREIVRQLIRRVDADTTGLYHELVRARSDVVGLSSFQLLGKDYKEGKAGKLHYGMSSVPLLLDSWCRRDERLGQALSDFLTGRALDLLVVLLYRRGDGFKRQLIVCSGDEHLLSHVVSRLEEPLGLAEASTVTPRGEATREPPTIRSRGVVVRSFTQGETGESRKRMEPRLREILSSL